MPREAGPSPLDERLEAATARLQVGLEASTRSQLLAYLDLIERWNRVYNLTAVRVREEMFSHHLLDCLAIVPALDRWAAGRRDAPRILDVGSGAGLPGVVLAIVRPAWTITCVDAVAKKATFIRQVATELRLPRLDAVHGRVESPSTFGDRRFDLIVSRAFASLHDFTSLTRHLLAPEGAWVAMKAHLSPEEQGGLPADVEMFHVEQLAVPELDATRRLVWLQPRSTPTASGVQPRQ